MFWLPGEIVPGFRGYGVSVCCTAACTGVAGVHAHSHSQRHNFVAGPDGTPGIWRPVGWSLLFWADRVSAEGLTNAGSPGGSAWGERRGRGGGTGEFSRAMSARADSKAFALVGPSGRRGTGNIVGGTVGTMTNSSPDSLCRVIAMSWGSPVQ
jgi:hypothetical protein